MSRSWKMHPVWQLSLARVREFLREPEAVFWTYVFPLVMIIALGGAFRSEPMEPVAVVVQDGLKSEELVRILKASPNLDVTSGAADVCRAQLRSGKSELIVIAEHAIPADAPAQMTPGSQYRYVFDPTRPGSVRARDVANAVLQEAAGRKEVIPSLDEAVEESGSRYIDFLVPGLIGMGLMSGGIWGVGFAIVDMRIRQLLKRFLGTPMRKHHFIAAMMISRIVFDRFAPRVPPPASGSMRQV